MKLRSMLFSLVWLAVGMVAGAGLWQMQMGSSATPATAPSDLQVAVEPPDVSPPPPATGDTAGAKPGDPASARDIPPSHRQYRVGSQYTLRSGVTVRLYHHRKSSHRQLTAADAFGPFYTDLLPLAQSGDAQAQLDLGRILESCENIPEDAKALEDMIASVHKTRRYRGGIKVDDPHAQEERLREEAQKCEGIPQDQRGRAREWVKAAADAGLLAAQDALASFHGPGDVYYLWTLDTPENNAQDAARHRESTAYREKARAAGWADFWAMGNRYSQTHKDDPPWERETYDAVRAFAYFLAADELKEALGEDRSYASRLSVINDATRTMTLNQLLEAQALSRSFLENPLCCVVEE